MVFYLHVRLMISPRTRVTSVCGELENKAAPPSVGVEILGLVNILEGLGRGAIAARSGYLLQEVLCPRRLARVSRRGCW